MRFPTASIPDEASLKASALAEALPWLQRLRGQIVVVKFGGNAMIDPLLTHTFAQDVTLLRQFGVSVVVEHGGGPQISAALQELGITSEFRSGLRVTDTAAIPVVRDVLTGQVAAGLVEAINENHDGLAVALPGDTEGFLVGERKGALMYGECIDLGYVRSSDIRWGSAHHP